MWLFKKKVKAPKPKPRILVFSEVQTGEIAELCDAVGKPNNRSAGRYNLWKRITEIFPEVDKGVWVLNQNNPVRYTVEEKLK